MLERIPFSGILPDSFFSLKEKIYAPLSYCPDEEDSLSLVLIQQESSRHEIILYTNHRDIRLLGIFPTENSTAYFGFWETTDSPIINQQAFAMLEADARHRAKVQVVGPYHFNTFHRYRLRLGEAPSWQMFDREPVNPPYYPHLLQQLGYSQTLGFESRLVKAADIPAIYQNKQLFVDTLNQLPFDFIPLNPDSWQANEAAIYTLVDAIFSQNPGYRAISRDEFERLYNKTYAEKLCPHTSVLFQEKTSGQLAALSFCHPNYHELPKQPAYTPRFTADYPRLKKKIMLAKTVGVHPNYRGMGLMSYLAAYGMLNFQSYYEEALFCLMRSGNYSLHFTDNLPYEQAQYGLFAKPLG